LIEQALERAPARSTARRPVWSPFSPAEQAGEARRLSESGDSRRYPLFRRRSVYDPLVGAARASRRPSRARMIAALSAPPNTKIAASV
jgi:hypothetical protein